MPAGAGPCPWPETAAAAQRGAELARSGMTALLDWAAFDPVPDAALLPDGAGAACAAGAAAGEPADAPFGSALAQRSGGTSEATKASRRANAGKAGKLDFIFGFCRICQRNALYEADQILHRAKLAPTARAFAQADRPGTWDGRQDTRVSGPYCGRGF